MDALQIIIPAATGILGLFIGYFLNQALYEKKRRDELADREYIRRAAIHDKRIQEAREYVEKHSTILNSSRQLARILAEENDPIKTLDSVLSFNDELLNIPSMMNETARKLSSIDLLNDEKLSDLHEELLTKFLPPYKELMTLEEAFLSTEKRIKKGEGSGVRDTAKDMNVERMIEAFREAEEIIPKMQARLDKLAQTVK